MLKKITLLSLLTVFMVSSVAFGYDEIIRGHHHAEEKCCKEIEKLKCIVEGIDSGTDKANCRLEDLLCTVNRLLEMLDCDICCKTSHIERDVNCIKETTNEILHCSLQHIKEKLCYLISIQTEINVRLNAFLDCNPCSKLDLILANIDIG